MLKRLLILLISLGLLYANPISIKTLSKILDYTKNVFFKRAEVLVNFEYINRIGIAWFEMGEMADKTITYDFNYMRFDIEGKILTDMRKFKIIPANLEAYGVDWETSIPTLHYFSDKKGNSWLIYSYSENGWHLGWIKVDSTGKVVEDVPSTILESTKPRDLIASPSDKVGYHLYWYSSAPGEAGLYYYNAKLKKALPLNHDFVYTETGITLSDSQFLLITTPNAFNRRIGPDSFEYRVIDEHGRLIKEKTLEWKPFVTCYWENIELPISCKTFKQDNTIYFLFSNNNRMNFIAFDAEGAPIKPDNCIKGSLYKIEQIPDEVEKFVKICKDTIYCYGFDNQGNLYFKKEIIGGKQ